MLDTNTVSYIARGRSLAARAKLEALRPPYKPCISAIGEAEIRYGLQKNPNAHAIRFIMEEFLAKIQILPWTSREAGIYADIRARLRLAGKVVETMDLLIAAHAISVGAVLVTSDKAFQYVHNPKGTVDWATDL